MKRRLLFLLVSGIIALIASLFWMTGNHDAPRYHVVSGNWTPPAYDALSYNSLAQRPFAGDKVWLTTLASNKVSHTYLFDLVQRKVLGELTNANPILLVSSGSKLLCMQRWQHQPEEFGFRIHRWLAKISRHSMPFDGGDEVAESISMLELGSGKNSAMDEIWQQSGASTTFQFSPDLRFGVNKGSAYFERSEIYVCDFSKKTAFNLNESGWPDGWWDNSNLVVKTTANDFIKFDVLTGKTNALLSATQIGNSLANYGLTNSPRVNLKSVWTGKQFDFYLIDGFEEWSAHASYLIKVTRPNAELELIDKNFKFEWSGRFDPTQRWYAFTGRDAGKGSDAVYLRDLQSHSERVLVPSLGTRSFSLPNFWGTNVIFIRSNRLWQISLDGGEPEPLFPPPPRN
ncbi:hypothetical protein GC207_13785 [bacterium]|nr:hypothetical protein [bacterium]